MKRAFGAAAFAALFIAACPRLAPRTDVVQRSVAIDGEYSDMGERLLHRVPGDVSSRMPLAAISDALLYDHAPADSILKRLPPFLEIALLFAAAGLLAPEGSFLAVATLIIVLGLDRARFYEQNGEACYTLILILVAALMIIRAQSPKPLGNLLLAFSIGASFLYRSPLVFLPPLLAVRDWSAGRKSLRDAGPWTVLIVPYLFLIPWVWLNHALPSHRWTLFEIKMPDDNIVSAALGLVHVVHHRADLMAMTAGTAKDYARGALWFAMVQILHHPLRYALSYAQRLRYVFLLRPWLVLAAGLGSAVSWRRTDVRQLALLCAYFVAVYCLPTVEARYLEPIWPLLALLAGASLLGFLPRSDSDRRSVEWRLSSGMIHLWLAFVLVLSLFSLGCVSAYAAALPRMDMRTALDRAIAGNPQDHWLYYERGKLNAQEGRVEEADNNFSKACALRPKFLRYRMARAWSLALRGRPSQLFSWDGEGDEISVLKADYYARTGHMKDAVRELRARFDKNNVEVRKGELVDGRYLRDYGAIPTALELDVLSRYDLEAQFVDGTLWMAGGTSQLLGREPALRRALALAFPKSRERIAAP